MFSSDGARLTYSLKLGMSLSQTDINQKIITHPYFPPSSAASTKVLPNATIEYNEEVNSDFANLPVLGTTRKQTCSVRRALGYYLLVDTQLQQHRLGNALNRTDKFH
jgi:hypothetical protein